jgi:CRISPR-associated endoribonuclease Cas6
MRFCFRINFEEFKSHLFRMDYRKNIMTLIKTAIESGDKKYFNDLYSNKGLRSFTFNCLIPGARIIHNGGIKNHLFHGKYIKIFFSCLDDKFLNVFAKGLKEINYKFSPFLEPVFYSHFEILEEKKILSASIDFKIMAPIVIRDTVEGIHTGKYLSVDDKNYIESLEKNIEFLTNKYLPEIEYKIKFDVSKCSIMYVSHYEAMKCTKGLINIKSNPEVLNLLYNIGIGARRSQGFGMVNI